jgi:hypothetical protein
MSRFSKAAFLDSYYSPYNNGYLDAEYEFVLSASRTGDFFARETGRLDAFEHSLFDATPGGLPADSGAGRDEFRSRNCHRFFRGGGRRGDLNL